MPEQEADPSICGLSLIGYKLVGDNIDKNVNPCYARKGNKTLSMHCYHAYAVRGRIDISNTTPNLQNVPLLSIPVHNVLPSITDERNLLHNFTLLTSRLLVEHFKYFRENYSDVVGKHIKHEFYDEMSQKSTIVSYSYYC